MGDLTRCLEPWNWIFTKQLCGGYWSKIFTLPYPLLLEQDEQFYLQQRVIIFLRFSDYWMDLWVKPYPEFKSTYYLRSCCNAYELKSNWKLSLLLQKIAIELPEVISSLMIEHFYDKTKQEQIKVIPVSGLIVKVKQVFKKIYETFGAKSR